jgi:hypothetical protein
MSSREPESGPRRLIYTGSLIPQLQQRYNSASEALAALRAAGFGVRRQTFLRLWGAAKQSQAFREQLGTADPYHVPEATEISQVPRPRARGYQYNIDVLMRDDTGSLYFTPTSVVTPDLITHLEAIERAVTGLRAALAAGRFPDKYGEVIAGGSVTSVLERIPEYDEPAE